MNTKIFEFSNYRLFLKEALENWLNSEGLSLRKANARCGFKAPNTLQLILSGQRNLAAVSAKKIAKALKMNDEQREYFLHLIELNQSTDVQKREQLIEKLKFLNRKKTTGTLPEASYGLYEHWSNVVVRECLGCHNGKVDIQTLHKKLVPSVSEERIDRCLTVLTKLGFVRFENGVYHLREATLRTGDHFRNILLIQFHMQMLDFAKESISRFSGQERELGALTLALSDEGFEKVKEALKEFKERVLEISEADRSRDQVYQLGLQLFPVSGKIVATDSAIHSDEGNE